MSKVKKEKIRLIHVLIVALVIRIIGFIIFDQNGNEIFTEDAESYIAAAKCFLDNGHFLPDGLRTPGYPLILALNMLIAGEKFQYVTIVIQILLNVGAIAYVYYLSGIYTSCEKCKLIVSIIAALNITDIYHCFVIRNDSITQSIFVASTYYLAKALRTIISSKEKDYIKDIFAGGALLSISILIRPSIMYLPIALTLGFIIVAIIKNNPGSIPVTIVAILLLSMIPVMVWTKRNEKVAGYRGYSVVADENLAMYNAASVYAHNNGISYYEGREKLLAGEEPSLNEYLNEMPKFEAYHKWGVEMIKSNIPFYVKQCFIDCVYLTLYPGIMEYDGFNSNMEGTIKKIKSNGLGINTIAEALRDDFGSILLLTIDVIALLAIALLAVIGAIRGLKENWIMALILIGIIAYFYVVSCQPVGIGAYSRFRMAISSLILPFVGVELERLICNNL